jgi:hypothetical protein
MLRASRGRSDSADAIPMTMMRRSFGSPEPAPALANDPEKI